VNQRSKITQAAAASTSDFATRRRRNPDSRAVCSRLGFERRVAFVHHDDFHAKAACQFGREAASS